MLVSELNRQTDAPDRLAKFIADPAFPCVGAKSALARGGLEYFNARDIRSAWDDLAIYDALRRFSQSVDVSDRFSSFAVIFDQPDMLDEASFERHLWERVQSLSDKDDWLGQPYDENVSPDPENPHFSLSFGGRAFFVVGLHPGASRKARRFERPAMIFNLHEQFERLRAEQRYEKMRATIIGRDIDYSGSENPMLARHGSISEARQYSGRAVDDGWRCPFSYRGEQPR
jgi:FPC/CPF motif-containing protein YcgG